MEDKKREKSHVAVWYPFFSSPVDFPEPDRWWSSFFSVSSSSPVLIFSKLFLFVNLFRFYLIRFFFWAAIYLEFLSFRLRKLCCYFFHNIRRSMVHMQPPTSVDLPFSALRSPASLSSAYFLPQCRKAAETSCFHLNQVVRYDVTIQNGVWVSTRHCRHLYRPSFIFSFVLPEKLMNVEVQRTLACMCSSNLVDFCI